MFSSKLFAMAVNLGQTRIGNGVVTKTNTGQDRDISMLSQRQTKLFNFIAKQTFLSHVVSVLLIIIVIVWTVNIIIGADGLVFFLFSIVVGGYFICVSITIPLSFAFADSYYYKCCSKCHKFCLHHYENKASKRLIVDDSTIIR